MSCDVSSDDTVSTAQRKQNPISAFMRKSKWRKPASVATAAALALGGGFFAITANMPTAQASGAQIGTMTVPGWFLDAPTSSLATGAVQELSAGMTPLDDQTLYATGLFSGLVNNDGSTTDGWVGYYAKDGNVPTSNSATVIAVGNESENLSRAGEWMGTVAVDAATRPGATEPYAYFYPVDSGYWSGNTVDHLEQITGATGGFGGVGGTTDVQALWRLASGQTVPEIAVMPLPNYFETNLHYSYWSGGTVNQETGEIYASSGECSGLDGTFRMMIFDGTTGAFDYSGQIMPEDSSDDIFGNGSSARGDMTNDQCPSAGPSSGYVASDLVLDADGNAYLLVQSSQPVPAYGIAGGASIYWLVRVVPSRDNGGTWTYNLVAPIQNAPGAHPADLLSPSTGIWGMAFYQGMIYVMASGSGGPNGLYQINPMSGYINTVPVGGATQPDPGFQPGQVSSLASGQTAHSIHGTVYDDATDEGIAGQTVAIYTDASGNGSGPFQFAGMRKTDSHGNYSFLVGGAGDYIVRLVQPTIPSGSGNAAAWEVSASVLGDNNTVTAQCQAGGGTGGSGVIESGDTLIQDQCAGAKASGSSDPALPTPVNNQSIDVATIPMYMTVDMQTSTEIAVANFGINAIPNAGASSLSLDKDSTQVGTPITATAHIVDSMGTPEEGVTVTFSSASGKTTITPSTCVTDADGNCSVAVTSTVAAKYTKEVVATIKVGGDDVGIQYSPATVTFTAGPPVPGPYTCGTGANVVPGTSVSAIPTTVQVDGTSAITGLVTDSFCNPVAGVPVTLTFDSQNSLTLTLAATSSGGTISGNTVTATTGANGKITADLTDHDTDVVTVTGTFDGTSLSPAPSSPAADMPMGSVDVEFIPGSFDGAKSTFTVTPVADPADTTQANWVPISSGGSFYTATLTALDDQGHAVDDPATVVFTPVGQNITVGTVTHTAGTNIFTAQIWSSSVQSASTLKAAYNGVSVVDSTSAVITKPIPFKAGPPVINPTCPTDQTGTNISADPTNLMVDNASTVQVLLTDQFCNPVAGAEVTFATGSSTTATLTPVKATTNQYGIATVQLNNTAVETVPVSATFKDASNTTQTVPGPDKNLKPTGTATGGNEVDVQFTTGAPAPGPLPCSTGTVQGSGIYADPTNVKIPGSSAITVVVTDQYCNPIADIPVALSQKVQGTTNESATANLAPIAGITDANGKVTAILFDNALETINVNAEMTVPARGAPITEAVSATPATVVFGAGDPSVGPFTCINGYTQHTGISAAPATVGVPGPSTATVLVTDQNCIPLPGVVVTPSVTGDGTFGTPPSGGWVTGSDGTVQIPVSDNTVEKVTVSATVPIDDPNNAGATIPGAVPGTNLDQSGADITFQAGPPVGPQPFKCTDGSTAGSTITAVTPMSVDDTNGSLVTVTARDQFCDPVAGATVTVTQVADATGTASSTAKFATTTGTTDPFGVATFKLTDTKAELINVSANISGAGLVSPITVGPAPVQFTAGEPQPGSWDCDGTPGTGLYVDNGVRTVDQKATVTALVTDKYCNPKQGVAVTLATLIGPKNTGTTPVSTTAALTNISNSGVTDASGRVTATLSDMAVETVTVNGTYVAAAGGNAAIGTVDVTFTIGAPVITAPADGTITNNNKPLISGTHGDPGATVTVTAVSGGKTYPVCTATADGKGAWNCTSQTALPDGLNTFTATQNDGVNTSAPSNSVTITIDTVAPDKPVITSPANGDPPTSNQQPPIVGTAAPHEVGGTITVIDITNPDARTTLCTGTVTSMGTWSCVPSSKMDEGTYTITATNTDLAGNVSDEAVPVTFEIKLGTLDPPHITTPVSSDKPTKNNSVTISGDQANPGATVTVRDNTGAGPEAICTAIADGKGIWVCSDPKTLPDGVNTLTATQTDPTLPDLGESGPSNPVLVVIDTSAPDAPVITSPADKSTVQTNQPLITGTANPDEVGGTVAVHEDGALICTGTIDALGNWSCTPTKALADGDHTITATETDMAGNVGLTSEAVTFTVDTTPAGAPRILVPKTSDKPSNNNKPPISGDKGTPGETVTVTDTTPDGTTRTVCTAVVHSDKTWSCTPKDPLPDGPNTLTATQTDPVNGESSPSNPVVIVIDTKAPAAPVITSPANGSSVDINKPPITGTANPDEVGGTVKVSDSTGAVLCTATIQANGTWTCTPKAPLAKGSHTIVATVTDVAGNVGPASAPVTFTVTASKPSTPKVDPTDGTKVTGETDPGTTITVYDSDDKPVPGCIDIAADSKGHFECTPDTPLKPGTEIEVIAKDKAGNESDPAVVTVGTGGSTPSEPGTPGGGGSSGNGGGNGGNGGSGGNAKTGGSVVTSSGAVAGILCLLAGGLTLVFWRKRERMQVSVK